MRSLLLSFMLFFAICSSTAYGKFLSLNEIGEAACRVRVSSAAGSRTSDLHQSWRWLPRVQAWPCCSWTRRTGTYARRTCRQ